MAEDVTNKLVRKEDLPMLGGGGYRAMYAGIPITFDSEDDFRRADMMIREMMNRGGNMMPNGNGGMMNGGMMNGRSEAGFLRTGAETLETVSAFFQARNLARRRDAYLDALDNQSETRDKLAALQSKYADLVPILLDAFQTERDTTQAAVDMLDDSITAVDLQAGAGVAKVVDDLFPSGGGRYGSGSGYIAPIGAAVAGIGFGWLLTERNGRRRGSTPRPPRR
jgi:hypothetical protein